MKVNTSAARRKRVVYGTLFIFTPLFIWVLRDMKTTDFTTNTAQTAPDNAELSTRFYDTSPAATAQKIRLLIPALRTLGRAWKLRATNEANGTTTIHCEVLVLVFTDDLIVEVRAENGKTRVDVRSQSRVGQADLGENRRHIRQFLQHLDVYFAGAASEAHTNTDASTSSTR